MNRGVQSQAMDISGALSSSNNSINIRPLFAGYPFQGTRNEIKLKKNHGNATTSTDASCEIEIH